MIWGLETMGNGLVVAVIDDVPFVKTPNGVVKLTDFVTDIVIRPGVLLA